jgi:hypothetical protein
MEGDKKFLAEIDKIVKRHQKFHEGDRVKVRGTKFRGIISDVISVTSIVTKSTEISYLVEVEGYEIKFVSYNADHLELIVTPEKVSFT